VFPGWAYKQVTFFPLSFDAKRFLSKWAVLGEEVKAQVPPSHVAS